MIVALLCVATSAVAQETEVKEAAKALYNEAREARKGDNFGRCHAKASAAWAIHKHPSIAALVGDCAVGIGKHRDAAEKLKFFFDAPKRAGTDELRKHLMDRFAEAKRHVALVNVSVSVSDAACEVDGERIDGLPASLYLDPGSHAFEARHPDYATETRQVTLAAGTTVDVALELKPLAVAGPAPRGSNTGPGIGYLIGAGASGVVALGGVAMIIASVVLHGQATDDIDRLDTATQASGGDAACNGASGDTATQCAELQSAIDDQSTFATLFPVGIIVAGVGAAAGATFLVLHFVGPESAEASLHVGPTGMSVRGRF